MKVRYSETALREIDEIFAYIHERNRIAAVAVVNRIERLASLIGEKIHCLKGCMNGVTPKGPFDGGSGGRESRPERC
jgi:plasmid stabilization system protein ParE